MSEDSMPSKRSFMIGERLVPEQEISERSDEMVRILALKDGVIAKLREQRDRARRQRIQMDAKSADFEKEAKRYRGELEIAKAEIAALTEQRDRALAVVEAAWRFEVESVIYVSKSAAGQRLQDALRHHEKGAALDTPFSRSPTRTLRRCSGQPGIRCW